MEDVGGTIWGFLCTCVYLYDDVVLLVLLFGFIYVLVSKEWGIYISYTHTHTRTSAHVCGMLSVGIFSSFVYFILYFLNADVRSFISSHKNPYIFVQTTKCIDR